MADLVPTDDGRSPSPAELAGALYAIQPELNDRVAGEVRIRSATLVFISRARARWGFRQGCQRAVAESSRCYRYW
jgi:hypothetical protein